MPCGPISTLVPQKYHRHLDAGILKSLLTASEEEQQRLSEAASLASLGIIYHEPTVEVYPQVLKSLNDIGREAVQEINPWVLNTLIDWCHFDRIICTSVPDAKDKVC